MVNSKKELDQQYKSMPRHKKLRHFSNGISHTTQWTGKEYKAMGQVFMPAIVGAASVRVQRAVKAISDFVYYAHFETHTKESLEALDAAWSSFHANKDVFKSEGPKRANFNISKLHNICHYIDSIRFLGTTDGYNTESSERLHIDHAKKGYAASNRKGYIEQMTTWFTRQEAVAQFGAYLWWIKCGSTFDNEEEVGSSDAAEEPEELEDEPEELENNIEKRMYQIAKNAPFPSTDEDTIMNGYGAIDFLYYLDQFIRDRNIPLKESLTKHTQFPVFKQVVLELPFVEHAQTESRRDVIQATRAEGESRMKKGGRKEGKGADMSMVLVRDRPFLSDDLIKSESKVLTEWMVYLHSPFKF
jgi:hypothetical protein